MGTEMSAGCLYFDLEVISRGPHGELRRAADLTLGTPVLLKVVRAPCNGTESETNTTRRNAS